MLSIGLSPNLEKDDIFAALSRLLLFWRWKGTISQERLEHAFFDYFNNENVYLFNSGRSALYVFLKSLNLKESDEILLQAFTCNAVTNPITWAGAKPIYADIDETYNIDVEKLEQKITPNTKAIIVQHTFGIPAKIDKIKEIAQRRDILLIEDCAHALGATYNEKRVGTFGDIAFFSFGRDKVISSVYGGALIINNKKFLKPFVREYAKLKHPSDIWTLQQIIHPIITGFVLATYNQFGKYLHYTVKRLKILSKAVTRGERRGKMPSYFPATLPEPLAYLALKQFFKLERFNRHRREIAQIYEGSLKERPEFQTVENYDRGAIFLRYPVRAKRAHDIMHHAREAGYILGDWYKEVIAPKGTDKQKMNYTSGNCISAEKYAQNIINLPTNIRTSREDAEKIIELLIRHK
ncbi:MAG: aminotransferase class I/II-fold pyridoxal phosphate-dependent enzyme [Candidatus Spechtbacterales bacterium]|nr:aminotransferase class I/II-fold pyridoxal phosphate-dependent enzyme [Candidatus Spechtbacterales bacterium]